MTNFSAKFQKVVGALICASMLLICAQSQGQSRPRGFVAVDPKPVRKQRLPASSTSATSAPSGVRIHPPFQSLEFGGRTYQYFEKRNQRGGITNQTLIGRDRVEILTDREGDGVVDSWDIFTGDGKMMFTKPHNGKFSFLQIEVMVPKGVMSYFYYWNKVKKSYSLYQQKGRPYKLQFLMTDFIVGCRGDAAELELEALASKLDNALDSGNMESELSEGLLKDAIDPSCKTGAFAKYTDSLLKGMMDVAKSDKKDWSNKDAKPSEQGSYLQCMRFYGLDVAASRIEAAFAQYTSLVPTNRYLWKVQCSAGKPGGKAEDTYGSFSEPTSRTQPPTINMYLNAEKLSNAIGSSNPTQKQIEDKYAFVYFHEMLHYAMMGESQAQTVGNCCGNPANTPSSQACKNLKILTEDTKLKQSYENYLIQAMPDKYSDFRDAIRQIWPNGDPDSYFESGLMNIARTYNEFLADPKCTATATAKNQIGNCEAAFKAEMNDMIRDLYGAEKGSQCFNEAKAALNNSEASATQACTFIQEILLSVANKGNTTDKLRAMCPQIKRSGARNLWRAPFAFASSVAFASESGMGTQTVTETFCGIANSLEKTEYIFNSKPVSKEYGDSEGSQSMIADPTSGTDANNSISKSPTNSKTTVPSSSNPSHPIFANDSNTRTRAIVGHLQGTDTVLAQFKNVAQKSFDTLIPKAQAENESWTKNSKGSKSANNENRDGYTVRNPAKSSIPDPLTNFGANGAGGVAISDRKPASAGGGTEAGSPGAGPRMTAGQGSGQGSGQSAGGGAGDKASQAANGKDGDPSALGKAGEGSGRESSEHPKRKLSAPEERALEALRTFLQNENYSKVKKDLDRPSVEGALLDHGIQVVDDEGRVHGSGFPEYNFAYDSKLGRLAPVKGSVRRPAAKKK